MKPWPEHMLRLGKMPGAVAVIFVLLNLTVLASSCPCPPHYVAMNDKCYFFSDAIVSSWQEAVQQCESMEAELLSVETEQEHLMIDAYLTKRGREVVYWTSGSDEGHQGQWKWKSTGKDFDFTIWSPGQPDNALGAEHCVHLVHETGTTNWNDAPCDQRWTWRSWPLRFVCEKSKIQRDSVSAIRDQGQDSCPCNGNSLVQSCNAISQLQTFGKCPVNFVQLAGKCYLFSEAVSTWKAAYSDCENLNSTLLSIESHAEAFALEYYFLQQNRVVNYWTSGSDAEVEGQWEWTAIEKPLTYTQWCKGQPDNANGNENYLHIYHNAGLTCWNDAPDFSTNIWTVPVGYICESTLS